jgi:hypothetical protein
LAGNVWSCMPGWKIVLTNIGRYMTNSRLHMKSSNDVRQPPCLLSLLPTPSRLAHRYKCICTLDAVYIPFKSMFTWFIPRQVNNEDLAIQVHGRHTNAIHILDKKCKFRPS